MNLAWLILALVVFSTTQVIAVWRWHRLLGAQHIEVERRAAIPVIAIPDFVGHLLKPVRALNRPWVTERAQRLEDPVLRFRKAPSAPAGAFGAAIVVQITIVAFYLLTAQGQSVPIPILLGAVLIPVSLAVQMAPCLRGSFVGSGFQPRPRWHSPSCQPAWSWGSRWSVG